jgi:uncharacterized Rmd1/YagE family protein
MNDEPPDQPAGTERPRPIPGEPVRLPARRPRNRGKRRLEFVTPGARSVRAREEKPLVSASRFGAAAWMLAERIDLKALTQLPVVASTPMLVRLPGGGIAALFRYGAVVTFGEDAGDRQWLAAQVAAAASGEGDPGSEERVRVEISRQSAEGLAGDIVRMNDARAERLQLLAEALAKAALLSFHERRTAGDFDRIEPLAQDLADDGRFSVRGKELLKAVGSMLLAEHRLTGRAEVMDKPELLWENPRLEGLYAKLEGELELRDRALALERKLATLSKTADTLVEAARHKSSLRVEWYIVLLIVFEIVLALAEKLGPS